MDKVIETQVDIDETTAKQIAQHVTVDTDAIAKAVADQMIAAQNAGDDKPENKNVGAGDDKPVDNDIAKMDAGARTRAHLKAYFEHDRQAVQKFNQYAVETNVKAGYMNVTTTADGGGFVPDADLLNEVFRLESTYGLAARLCRVVNVTSDSVKAAALSTTVEFTEVIGETGVKSTTKPTFTYPTVDLREFAGIVAMTDQLLEDAAFDVRGFVAEELARAAAKKEDELLLTDATTGVLNIAGTNTVTAANLAAVDFDDVIDAVAAVPSASAEGGSWIVGRTVVPQLRKIKDTNGQYLWAGSANAETPSSLGGSPYYVSDLITGGAGAGVAAFGNWGRYAILIRKAGLKLTFHDSGTVNVGGTDYNLIHQDMTALRAVIRRNVFIPLPDAFAVIRTTA